MRVSIVIMVFKLGIHGNLIHSVKFYGILGVIIPLFGVHTNCIFAGYHSTNTAGTKNTSGYSTTFTEGYLTFTDSASEKASSSLL